MSYDSEQEASDAFKEELNEVVEVIELKPKVKQGRHTHRAARGRQVLQ